MTPQELEECRNNPAKYAEYVLPQELIAQIRDRLVLALKTPTRFLKIGRKNANVHL